MHELNDIKLPSSIIANLYKDHLVLLTDEVPHGTELQPETQTVDNNEMQHMGANKKKIVLLVNHEGIRDITDEENTFLNKMLEACKMSMEDVAIVPGSRKHHTAVQLKESFDPSRMILFGLRAEDIDLPLRFPDFKLQSYDDTVYLQVPDLKMFTENTEESKALKGKLWACLKSLFQLK